MVHGYHVIFGAYGFWLPNDPRGSWSDFVGRWELVRFGRATKSIERTTLTGDEERQRQAAKNALLYPPVEFTDDQIESIAAGFARRVSSSNLTLWACSIMPSHVHLVVARHSYSVEQMANLLKGQATKQLRKDSRHPMGHFTRAGDRPPTPWADRRWKVYLDNDDAIRSAIRYVDDNPENEGRLRQLWPFVTPFRGIESGNIIYH